jgi:PhoP regulatory network protein YrbL
MIVVTELIGKGKEKACYHHPLDTNKCIKIPINSERKQTDREIRHYKQLSRRKNIVYSHLPQFYGGVQTQLGDGYIVDLIRDYDGQISQSMQWYLTHGMNLTHFLIQLDELKKFFLDNLVIFNHDMFEGNLLVQKLSATESRLVIIDGIGDVIPIQLFNAVSLFAQQKINRRWERFFKRLCYYNPLGESK